MNCCNIKAIFVDNVPGREYWYCRECKQEVKESVAIDFELQLSPVDLLYYHFLTEK